MLTKLVTSAGTPVEADELIELFWPGHQYEKALEALYTTMSRVRKLLKRVGAESVLLTTDDGYIIKREAIQTDVKMFLEKVAFARVAEVRGELNAARQCLSEALSLRRPGELLNGVDCPVLVEAEAPPLKRMLTSARERWCGLGLQLGESWDVLPFLNDLAQEDPLNESAHEKLMRALLPTRGQAAALGVYYAIRDRLAEELGIDPGPSLQALYLNIIGATKDDSVLAR
ncbi:MAG: AfsR/SARP family transcriptional regulator [Streptosporangiales bacterium]|nr:AfsR/SARP family transcriptional regulator [Streptosporangiales bacterium]